MTRKHTWLLIALGMVAAILVGAVACSDDDEPSPEEARAALCNDLETFGDALDDLGAIGPDSTIGELRAARDAVGEAMDDVTASAEDVENPPTAELENAYTTFTEAVDDLPDDVTISEAMTALELQAAAVDTAWQDAYASADCAGEPTSEPTAAATIEEPTAEATAAEPTAAATTEPTAAATAAATVEATPEPTAQ